MGQDLPAGMAREGDAMLAALLADLGGIAGVSAVSSRDPRLPPPATGGEFIEPEGDIWAFWERLMGGADALWPIAPETGGVLARMSRLAGAKALIGTEPETVAVAGSKRRTANLLAAHGLATVPTVPTLDLLPPSDSGWVVKPDEGVGAQGARIFESGAALAKFFTDPRDSLGFVAQPYLQGVDASISAVFRDGEALVLSCNRQTVRRADRSFQYAEFEVGGLEDMRPEFAAIARRVANAMPGLRGFAGIDLVVTESGPVVLEVNPRLTTPYAGMSEALGQNAAKLILDFLAGRAVPEARPRRAVRITVDAHD